MNKAKLIEAINSLDQCYMMTIAAAGEARSRPMAKNGQVEWDGRNWFFSDSDTCKVKQIKSASAAKPAFSSDLTWATLSGRSKLHRENKALFEKRCTPELGHWFKVEINAAGMTLTEVFAYRAG